jgi:uncharacterized membrane protein YeaQ/YmgE (transglycosylase-associated protein family)
VGITECKEGVGGNAGVDATPITSERAKENTVTITGIIVAIIVGLIIGALGRLVVPGRQSIPLWLTLLIGVVAALLGSVLANALGVGNTRGFDWIEFVLQVGLAAAGVALVAGSSRHRTI